MLAVLFDLMTTRLNKRYYYSFLFIILDRILKFPALFADADVVLRQPAYWCNYSKPRMILHSFVSSKYFDLANAGVIGLNVIMMALEYYLMPWVSTRDGPNVRL